GKRTSADDMRFLIAYARQLPNADWDHVGVIGHSGGAHATLTYRTQVGCLADAVVSLDTTQDYFGMSDKRWGDLTGAVVGSERNVTGPVLMVANPHAFFELAESLQYARRYYLTIKDLGHNDFISQGKIGRELRYRLQFPDSDPAGAGPPAGKAAAERAG